LQKLNFIYGNVLLQNEKMALLRNYIFNSDKKIFKRFKHSIEKNEFLDYFVDFDI